MNSESVSDLLGRVDQLAAVAEQIARELEGNLAEIMLGRVLRDSIARLKESVLRHKSRTAISWAYFDKIGLTLATLQRLPAFDRRTRLVALVEQASSLLLDL